jgi:succinate dehydrogenase (ubiquinone) cytochrome b560 subunit
LVSPVFGWHLDVNSMAVAFGALPIAVKVGVKSLIAAPFAFHSINGVRHLVWDTASGKSFCFVVVDDVAMSNKMVIRTGWTVVGLSAVATVALVAM